MLYGCDIIQFSQPPSEGKFSLPQFANEETDTRVEVLLKAIRAVNDGANI